MHAKLVGDIDADNSSDGNDDSYVLVGTDGPGTNVNNDQSWANLPVPYRIKYHLRAGAELTLSPGITMTFEQDQDLQVQNSGALIADASGDDRLEFIAADGETVNGYWKGIGVFKRSSKNVIANTDIVHGGSARWHDGPNSQAGAFLRTDATIQLTDVEIGGSGKHGVSVDAPFIGISRSVPAPLECRTGSPRTRR